MSSFRIDWVKLKVFLVAAFSPVFPIPCGFNCILLFRNGILSSLSHESLMYREYLHCGNSGTSYRQNIIEGCGENGAFFGLSLMII